MPDRCSTVAVLLGVLLGPQALSAPARADPARAPLPVAAAEEEWERLLRRAREQRAAGQKAEALASYRLADAARGRKPAVVCELGALAHELGKNVLAARHLSQCVRLHGGPAEERAGLEALLTATRAKVGTLVVSTQNGAEVEIEGELVGRAPLADPVFADPGTRTVSASLNGHRPLSVTLVVKAGEERRVDLTLTPRGSYGWHPAMWVTGIFGFGFLAAGGPIAITAGEKHAKAEELRAQLASTSCVGAGQPAPCAHMRIAEREANSLFVMSGIFLVAGATAGVIGIASAAVGAARHRPELRLGAGPGGVSIRASW